MQPEHGTLAARVTIPAGETRKLRFVISWNFPDGDIYWAFRDKPGRADPRQADAALEELVRDPVAGLRSPAPAMR